MFIEFEKVWSWFQNAGFPDKARKWVAWTFIIAAVIYGLLLLWEHLGSKNTPLTMSFPVGPPLVTPPSTPLERHRGIIQTSPSCAVVLKVSRDYNFDDGTHQLEAWDLFERALTNFSFNEKATVNMLLVEEARRDWKGGQQPKVALAKFKSAFSCESAWKP